MPSEMDSTEAEKVVHERIKQLEPHIPRKIIGYMYLQDIPDQEMIRLALGPDSLILNFIQKAKSSPLLAPTPILSPPISPTMNPSPLSNPLFPFSSSSPHPFSAPASFQNVASYWEPQRATEQQAMHNAALKLRPSSDSEYSLPNQLTGSDDPLDYFSPETAFNNLSIRGSRNSRSTVDYPVKICHYFNRGFCKHGSNCRFFHGESFIENYQHVYGPNSHEAAREDQVFCPGSLEKLELEVIELLKSNGRGPVSIASLPSLYHDKYGRTLQAEGYLTESQRHGKAGYSLTKLLARLKNSICLIDRPHGQHSVILAEDAPKYMDVRAERNEPGPIVNGSRQIYLTFPAESTFIEEDVSNYFSTFGPVQDVRIPCQQKRMFGFVTFVSADTVKMILSKGNPHYVCGARVLVKPYREKSKLAVRKCHEKFQPAMYFRSHPIAIDPELQARSESYGMFRRQLMEDHRRSIELEARRVSQFQLASKPLAGQSFLGYSMDELRMPEGHSEFPSADRYYYLLDVLNSGSSSDDYPKFSVNNCRDHDGAQGLNLPDNPFAPAFDSSISAVM
ncbi:UNVERIFIED_CONTAM: Zinc finger CCCH domain-containing protein 18 [Sesamum radiatum]|uniref:Zinc finger CCCH domain-containing protein 18 n=1 Tax=Sesamum radiatum TaxID=300843 RepID=A0AAW2LT15_SESRA